MPRPKRNPLLNKLKGPIKKVSACNGKRRPETKLRAGGWLKK